MNLQTLFLHAIIKKEPMKNFFYALKQYYKSAPILITIKLLLTVLPVGILSGFITNYERLMINSAQNYIVGNGTINNLTTTAIIYLSLMLASVVLSQVFNSYLSEKIAQANDLYFNKKILAKYKTIKYEYFEQENMLDLFEKSGSAYVYLNQTFNSTISVIGNIISIASSIVAMWIISPLFSMVAIGVGIVVFVFSFLRIRLNIKLYSRHGVERRKIVSYKTILMGTSIAPNEAELRVFGTNPKMIDYINDGVVENTKKREKKAFIGRIYQHLSTGAMLLMEAFILIYIFVGLKNNTLNWPIGNIVVALTGFISIAEQFFMISYSVCNIIDANKKIDFVQDFFNLEDEKEGTINSIPKNAVVEIKNVSFTYPGTTKEILHNVSFNITCGEHIAFVGENGSGKSTIIKLILGLYQPTKGEIVVNDHKITDYTRAARQKLFGVQYQDFYEYSLKIREVVAMGNIGLLDEDKKIKDTLKAANILDAINAKNATLDTMVGKSYDEDSIEFSGGEKQRMSLATTLAFNHNHLVLDEPTAALDAKAENMMYEVFMSGIKDKGSLIVSHRLASAKISDRIIVFQNGQVVQDGSHAQLIKDTEGLYHKMFTAQAKLYKAGKEA